MMLIEQLALKCITILIMLGIAFIAYESILVIYNITSDGYFRMSKTEIILSTVFELFVDLVIILFIILVEIKIFKLVF